MPFVRSYFRRSAGTAAALAGAAGGQALGLDLALYDVSGNLLRDGQGSRYHLDSVRFATALPGGFTEAAFRVSDGLGRGWPGRAGLQVAIRQGQRTVWWGWIEDIRRSGPYGETVTVSCLGPWQILSQRLFSPNYTGTVYGDVALKTELANNVSELSTDTTQIAATGINIAALDWDYRTLAELVRKICDAGNTSNLPMLFAIWDPSGKANVHPSALTSLLTNSNLEAYGAGVFTGWAGEAIAGNPSLTQTSEYQKSGTYGAKISRGTDAGNQELYFKQREATYDIPCAPSTSYTFDAWVYFGAVSGIRHYWRVAWYTSGGSYISQSTTTGLTSGGAAGWQRCVETLTSPANATRFWVTLRGILPSGTESFKIYDDLYVYASGATPTVDNKPRATLWARDLSAYDYSISPAALAEGLTINTNTRSLVNNVVGSYGSGPTYQDTADGEDATSQGLYRKRDYLLTNGDVAATLSTQMIKRYLAAYKDPLVEPQSFRLAGWGAVTTRYGQPIDPLWLRAGDRLRIADGELAGTVIMLTKTEYADGVVTCTPERVEDVAAMLARV